MSFKFISPSRESFVTCLCSDLNVELWSRRILNSDLCFLKVFNSPYISGITASSESLIFAADGTVDDEDEGIPSDYGMDGSAPWYLRVQELAHDSLIAATRAQLARDAKASQDARAAGVGNGETAEPSPKRFSVPLVIYKGSSVWNENKNKKLARVAASF